MKKLSILLIVSILTIGLSGLKPQKDYEVSPADFGIKYREVSIPVKGDIKLKGWFFTPAKKSGTVIVLSHDGDGNMGKMLTMASQFTSMGFNVLTYDYRGFGGSSPFKIINKMAVYPRFADDLNAAIDFAHKTFGVTRVFLYGKGMGAALSIGACSARRDVQKVIADSPWDDLNHYQQLMAEVKGEEVMIPPAYDKQKLEPRYALTGKFAKTSKYLLINGADDQVFTTKMMKSLAKLNKGNVEVYTVKKAVYATTYTKDKAAWFERVKSFVK